MAQHDYNIANGSGSAVRADLNDALAAIVSNNSGSIEPTTTFAYQWWPDTTTDLLKIRNAANNAWVTVGSLADTNLGLLARSGGTMTGALLADDGGTAALPAIAFDGDTDTGAFRPGANQYGIATNGVERVEWGTSEVVFNDGGANYDFRVEGDTKANLLLIDASADTVSIDGTAQLANQTPLRFGDSDNSHYVGLRAPSTVAANVTFDLPATDGTADQVLKTDGGGGLGWATPTRMVLETAKTASGTEVDFTGIPSWVKKITVMFSGVSTSGSSNWLVQLGTSSGIETTGYDSSSSQFGAGVSTSQFTAGFGLTYASATAVSAGSMRLTKVNGDEWVAAGVFANTDSAATRLVGGSKSLSGTLDRVRITTVSGTNTFDAGTINILLEG